jgi:MSHA biogenesis protein MshI
MIQKLVSIFKGASNGGQKSAAVAALHLHADSLKLVVLHTNPYRVEKVETLVLTPDKSLMQAASQLASELGHNVPLCLVLSAERYQLLQLDKPAVPEAEMLQALPWLARELTSVPVEDMLLDYLDLPEQASQQVARINVVVTAKSSLLELCRELQRRKVQITNIQPEEWLPRNLLPVQNAAVMLIVHQPGQELMLQIIRQGALYFSRRLRGFNRIDQYAMAELSQGMLDNLLLEVQRSLDYFEGQLKQAPVKEILFQIASNELPGIVKYFADNGFGQVRQLELAALMPGLNQAEQQDYWLTLAGALELQQSVVPVTGAVS